MTPEELRDKIIPIIDGCNCNECRRDALRAIKRFRKQVLEEAAKFVEENYEEPFINIVGNPSWRERGRESLADAIRALKQQPDKP